MLLNLGWDSLELRRIRLRLVAIYKEAHKITPSKLILDKGTNPYKTRQNTGTYIIEEPDFNKQCYQYSLYPRTIREWNMLPPEVRIAPDIKTFKEGLQSIDLIKLVKQAHFKI